MRNPVWSVGRVLLALFILSVSSGNAGEIRRTPLILSKGGTPERPAVFDGQGLEIDLGIDVTERAWQKSGDIWRLPGGLEGLPPRDDVQRAGLFIDEVPLRIMRDRTAEKATSDPTALIFVAADELQPGQMGWAADGAVYFRWPDGKSPEAGRIIQPPSKLESCVVIACSHIVVKNIIARHAVNDGFNIHGHRVGIRLENIKAFSNGDEGISAHETVEMEVFDSEIAWNGSTAGGVADVNDSTTSYTNCNVHHNLGAGFFFDGKSHRITNCRIHNQTTPIVARDKAVEVTVDGQPFKSPAR